MTLKPRPSFPVRLDRGSVAPRPAVGAPPTEVNRVARTPVATSLPAQARVPGSASSAARMAMVNKLAAMGLNNGRVLAAMAAIERHRFVDSALLSQAYEDTSLPIGWGQTISKPGVVSRMIELLLQGRTDKPARVLEIGTGCGYQAAVLSCVATEVYSIERVRGLHEKARDNLRPLRLPNVHLLFGDGMAGFPSGAPYACIIAAAGGEALPPAWLEQLAVGGRLVAPVATKAGSQQALVVIDKTAQGVRQSVLESVHFVPLKSGIA